MGWHYELIRKDGKTVETWVFRTEQYTLYNLEGLLDELERGSIRLVAGELWLWNTNEYKNPHQGQRPFGIVQMEYDDLWKTLFEWLKKNQIVIMDSTKILVEFVFIM
jgi:hypothetical protein